MSLWQGLLACAAREGRSLESILRSVVVVSSTTATHLLIPTAAKLLRAGAQAGVSCHSVTYFKLLIVLQVRQQEYPVFQSLISIYLSYYRYASRSIP